MGIPPVSAGGIPIQLRERITLSMKQQQFLTLVLSSLVFFQAEFNLFSAAAKDAAAEIDPAAAADLFAKNGEPPPPLQDLFDAMGEDIPAIALIRPELGNKVEEEWSKVLLKPFVEAFIRQQMYRPFSIDEWIDTDYGKDSKNIVEFLRHLAAEEFPLDWLMTGSVQKVGKEYLIRIGFYEMKHPANPWYFFREVNDMVEWEQIFPTLFEEIGYRLEKPHEPLFVPSIYIEPFVSALYMFTELSTGENAFTKVPFMQIKGVDFRQNDDLISNLLIYKLHTDQIINVIAADLFSLQRENGVSPSQYTLKGELRTSPVISLINIEVFRNSQRNRLDKVFDFQVPLKMIDRESASNAVSEIVKMIYGQFLTETDKERLAYINMDLSSYGNELYYKGYYLGEPHLRNYCLPFGTHWFSALQRDNKYIVSKGKLNEASVSIFVSPIDKTGIIQTNNEAQYLQTLLEIGGDK